MIFEIITYIITVSLATIIPPFVAVPIELVAASRYGLALSFIFTLVGNTVGAVVAFLLGRRFGWPIIERLFSEKQVKKAKKVVGHFTFWHLTWTRIIFTSIFDILSYACGLTEIEIGKFILSTVISVAPSTALILFFGNKIDLNYIYVFWMTGGILLASIIIMIMQLVRTARLKE